MNPLSPVQKKVLDIILNEWRQRQRAPTLRDVAKSLGVSTGAAFVNITALRLKGYLTKGRYFTPTDPFWISCAECGHRVLRKEVRVRVRDHKYTPRSGEREGAGENEVEEWIGCASD